VRITNVRKDGSPFLNELTLHPVYDSCGMYRFNIGVLADAGAPVWATWKRLRASVPTCFEAELQPSRAVGDDCGAVDPIGQWKQCQPMSRQPPTWATLESVFDMCDRVSGSSAAACEAAVQKLISNHERVLLDLTNGSTTNIEGRKLTQSFTLRRVVPEPREHVDSSLRERARRLLYMATASSALTTPVAIAKAFGAAACVAAAKYLDGCIQSSPEEKPGRAHDMTPAAAAAMRGVMAVLRKEAAPLTVGMQPPLVTPATEPEEPTAGRASSRRQMRHCQRFRGGRGTVGQGAALDTLIRGDIVELVRYAS